MRACPVLILDTICLTMSASLAFNTTIRMAVRAKKGVTAYPMTPEMSQKSMVMIQKKGVIPTSWDRSSSWGADQRACE